MRHWLRARRQCERGKLLVLMRGRGGAGGGGGGGRVAECESGSGESVAEQTPGPAQSSGHCIDTETIPTKIVSTVMCLESLDI